MTRSAVVLTEPTEPLRRSPRKRKPFLDNDVNMQAVDTDSSLTAKIIRSSDMRVNEMKKEKENRNGAMPSSINMSLEPQKSADADEDDATCATTNSSPFFASPPMATEEDNQTTPPTGTIDKRLSPLLSLRPPSLSTAQSVTNFHSTPSSILRRRCTPAKEGEICDGTQLESSAENPTSDRHFDALVTFAASSISPMGSSDCDENNEELGSSSYPSDGVAVSQETSASFDESLVIDMETLGQKLKEMFPQQFSRLVGRGGRPQRRNLRQRNTPPPCILPRLIACYTIHREFQNRKGENGIELFGDNDDTYSPMKKRKTGNLPTSSSASTDFHEVATKSPIRNILQALVNLEWVVLEGHEHRLGKEEGRTIPSPTARTDSANAALKNSLSNLDAKENHRVRRVQFAAFDDEAVVRAPCDVLEGSYKPQDDCVKALVSVLDSVEDKFPMQFPAPEDPKQRQNTASTKAIRDFVFYLDNEFLDQCHDEICVKSIMTIENQSIPTRRIAKAAKSYSKDLKALIDPKGKRIHRLYATVKDGDLDLDEVVIPLSIETVNIFSRSVPLSWEYRLADTSSQLLRYWLRTLLNPIPGRVDPGTKTEQWSSRLIDYVQLIEPSEDEHINSDDQSSYVNFETTSGDDVTSEKDNLSSLLSNALAHFYLFLDLGSVGGLQTNCTTIAWKNRLLDKLPDETCCDTFVCRQGLGTGKNPTLFTAEDWADIEENLQTASLFCAFHRKVVFMERLLSIIAKHDCARKWVETVQEAAKKLFSLISLNAIQPGDVHLVLLALPLQDLIDRFRRDILPVTRKRYVELLKNLRVTERNFRLGKKMTKLKKNHQPNIERIENFWMEWYDDRNFPSIRYRPDDH